LANELEYARRYSGTQFKRYTETKGQLINDDAVYTTVGVPALLWEIPKRPLSRTVTLKAAVTESHNAAAVQNIKHTSCSLILSTDFPGK
jgi:hypothetical protein